MGVLRDTQLEDEDVALHRGPRRWRPIGPWNPPLHATIVPTAPRKSNSGNSCCTISRTSARAQIEYSMPAAGVSRPSLVLQKRSPATSHAPMRTNHPTRTDATRPLHRHPGCVQQGAQHGALAERRRRIGIDALTRCRALLNPTTTNPRNCVLRSPHWRPDQPSGITVNTNLSRIWPYR